MGMQTGLNEDQIQFRDVVARFFAAKSPPGAVRELMASAEGYDAEVWQQLSSEVGLCGIHIPEAYGGAGFGLVELGIAAQEMGRYLYCGPFFATSVMAAQAILYTADDAQKQAFLPGLADGSTLAALVLDDLDSAYGVGASITATAQDDGYVLNGVATKVVDAHIANTLLIAARSPAGLSLFQVSGDASGLAVEPLEALDPTRKLSRVRLDGCAAHLMGSEGQFKIMPLWDQMSVILAQEMIGGATALLESTIEYTKMRVQFGRQIGSFQGLKHRCADLLMEVELAKAAVEYAAQALVAGEGDPHAPNMAKAMASDAYMSAARTAIQLRGGIGFTWENDTHLWFKRAKSSEVFLGTPTWHREEMMKRIAGAAHAQ
jgi:alkylation response protein AidB-like acyl-CoA dehydrogenase